MGLKDIAAARQVSEKLEGKTFPTTTDEVEEFYNQNHDENGKFTTGKGGPVSGTGKGGPISDGGLDHRPDIRDAFLKDVADKVNYWESHAKSEVKSGKPSDEVVKNSLRGLAHSILVSIDGGTNLSGKGRVAWLKDSKGNIIGEGLHERLFDHLPDN